MQTIQTLSSEGLDLMAKSDIALEEAYGGWAEYEVEGNFTEISFSEMGLIPRT